RSCPLSLHDALPISSEKEILSARLIDRVIRPLFPDTYFNEVQVYVQVISSDGQNDADVLGGTAVSAALTFSDIPFDNTMAEVRIDRKSTRLNSSHVK